MRSQSEKMIAWFVSQFAEEHGYVIYRRQAFASPWEKKAQPYIVTAAERDGFIADFRRDAPLILRRMRNDIFIAFASFVVTSQISHLILGEFAAEVELALLLAHIGTITVIEQRRLARVWDAPLRALALRAPAPFPPDGRPGIREYLARLDGRELGVGGAMGLICGANAGVVLAEGRGPEVSALTYYGGLALMVGILALGIVCAGEGALRLIERNRA